MANLAWSSPLLSEKIAFERHGRDLAGWLIIVPLVLFLLFGCSHLALLAAPPPPRVDTRSKLQADYSPWPLVTIPAINPAIVAEIAHDQATPVPEPITGSVSFWSTPAPTPTGMAANPTPASATPPTAIPTRTAKFTSTVTRQPTATLTRTLPPTRTSTATATRTKRPLPTRTPTPAPTSTFTPVPTDTPAPPPPPPTSTPSATATLTLLPATSTPSATVTPVPPTFTFTPTPTETPTPVVCLISAGGVGVGGSALSWSVTNSGATTVNLVSASANWDASLTGQVWLSLDFGGSSVWPGPGINAPGGSVGTSGAVDLPTGSKGMSFNFNQALDTTSGFVYSVTATFDNGCSVGSSVTMP